MLQDLTAGDEEYRDIVGELLVAGDGIDIDDFVVEPQSAADGIQFESGVLAQMAACPGQKLDRISHSASPFRTRAKAARCSGPDGT